MPRNFIPNFELMSSQKIQKD